MLNIKNYSIIIPHHNTPDLLRRLIDSIPQREDIEIIVVDDNSDKDKKVDVLRTDVKTFFIDEKHSKGAGKARNVGLDAATGKWLIFADADDLFETQALGDAMDSYRDADADVIVFPIRVVKSETLEEGPWRDQWFNKVFYSDKTPRQKLLATAACWSKFIKRTVLEQHNIRFEEIKYSNDQWFSANVAINADRIVFSGHYCFYTLTYSAHSLTRSRSLEAFECRFNAELRMWQLLLSHGMVTERNTYPRFLSWASSFGAHKVIDTYYHLIEIGVPNTTTSAKFRIRRALLYAYIGKAIYLRFKK